METADRIISYIKETYQPDAIITYGSFADGSANEGSDFDALVIANHDKMHDASVIDGIILDVFIYPTDMFQSEYAPEEFVQVWDGKIIMIKMESLTIYRNVLFLTFNAHRQKPQMKFNRRSAGVKRWCQEQCVMMPKVIIVGIGCCLIVWRYTVILKDCIITAPKRHYASCNRQMKRLSEYTLKH